MNLTFSSFLEWTKLFVRDPRTATRMVKSANLPLEASIMMIVLAGVVSTAASGLHHVLLGSPSMEFVLADGERMVFSRSGPIAQGLYAVISGIGLAYAIYQVGRRMGGSGSLSDIMAVTAVLQLVVTGIVVAQTILGLTLPLLGLILMVLGAYVFLRGLCHAVNEGHEYNSLGKSAWVIFLSFMVLVFVIFVLSAVFGLGPQGVIRGAEL